MGGRYSALSAFGLVPTALAGVDVAGLLDDASALPALDRDDDNPGLTLGAVLGEAGLAGRDKVVIADFGSRHPGFGDWAEQLVAESTGKQGTGLLPVVVESVESPGFSAAPDRHWSPSGSTCTSTAPRYPARSAPSSWCGSTPPPLPAGCSASNPFDQPNVQESKDNTGKILDEAGDGPLPEGTAVFTEGAVEVHTDDPILLGGAHDLARSRRSAAARRTRRADTSPSWPTSIDTPTQPRHWSANRWQRQTERPVMFGWAPRFLHSTGQYHKGGPQTGAFLQITGVVMHDLAIPGRPFGFARLQMAQALGDCARCSNGADRRSACICSTAPKACSTSSPRRARPDEPGRRRDQQPPA